MLILQQLFESSRTKAFLYIKKINNEIPDVRSSIFMRGIAENMLLRAFKCGIDLISWMIKYLYTVKISKTISH